MTLTTTYTRQSCKRHINADPDIAAGGGADDRHQRMTGTGSKVRVAIIRAMKSVYYLAAARPPATRASP